MPTPPDALALPLVAYRGLWDKFAAPGSDAAIHRAYRRGLPSLVPVQGPADLARAIARASDLQVNRQRVPLFLVAAQAAALALEAVEVPPWLRVHAIDTDGAHGATWPIFAWQDERWQIHGCYVPVAAARRGLAPQDLGGEPPALPLLIFESTNVTGPGRAALSGSDTAVDDAVLASVRSLTGPSTVLARVSDLVELDLMSRQMREAA